MRPGRADLVVLAAYAATSFAYFGWRLLPDPGEVLLGPPGDPSIFVWSFGWWPHAIGSWVNPFHTEAIYAPDGVNLAWATTVPGLALAFSPLTVLFGPTVSYNVAALLAPALSAWTAYLLCRYLTGSLWASLVGGYVFGFSAFVLSQLNEGRLHMEAVFLVPLFALVVVRYLRCDLDGRGLAWRLGVLLALQLSLSTELATSATLALAVGLALAFWLVREARARLRSSLLPIAAGYALAGLLAAPLLVYALVDGIPGAFSGANLSRSDLLNFVLPTRLFGIGGSSLEELTVRFPRGGQESGAYLGLPLLVVLGLFAFRSRGTAAGRFLLVAAALAAVVALGDGLRVAGDAVVALPWALVDGLPLLDNVKPSRFTVYLSLVAAIAVALWISTTRGRIYARPYVLPALAVAFLVPAVWQPLYHSTPERPAFFAGGYETCLTRGETVAIFPLAMPGREAMIWQAESGFWFRMAGGSIGPGVHGVPPLEPQESDPVAWELNFRYETGRPTMERLLAYAAEHEVDRVVALESEGYPSAEQMRTFGPVQRLGGVLVAPACDEPSLAARDLTPFVRAYREQVRSGAEIGYCLGSNYHSLSVGLEPAGLLEAATPASFVAGRGLTCEPPPRGYVRRGFATPEQGVPADTYPLWVPPAEA